MNSAVSLDKIEYMMNRLGGDDELSVADLESMIIKVFVSSFEQEHGFEADLVRALLAARHNLLVDEYTSDDDIEKELPLIARKDVENKYLKFQSEMYVTAGCDPAYAEESASWPDSLPLDGDWDKDFLRAMARKAVAHHLVVTDQIRAAMLRHEHERPTND